MNRSNIFELDYFSSSDHKSEQISRNTSNELEPLRISDLWFMNTVKSRNKYYLHTKRDTKISRRAKALELINDVGKRPELKMY